MKCGKCGGPRDENHSYCKPCKAQYQREYRIGGSSTKFKSDKPKQKIYKKADDYGYFY